MIQDLGEKKLYNEFEEIEAGEQDNVFCFDGDKFWYQSPQTEL